MLWKTILPIESIDSWYRWGKNTANSIDKFVGNDFTWSIPNKDQSCNWVNTNRWNFFLRIIKLWKINPIRWILQIGVEDLSSFWCYNKFLTKTFVKGGWVNEEVFNFTFIVWRVFFCKLWSRKFCLVIKMGDFDWSKFILLFEYKDGVGSFVKDCLSCTLWKSIQFQ